MKNKQPKKILILLFLLALIAWPARSAIVAGGPLFALAQTTPATGPFDYTPMETLPGFEAETSKPVDFYDYISMAYQVGIWSIGMLAMFMIIFGGYTYIAAAGNNSSMEKGKTIITDAIIGLLLALVSYLVLYVINPDLIKLQRLEPGAQTQQAEQTAAGKYDGTSYPVIQSKLPQSCNAKEWQTIFNEVSVSSGIDKCILMATIAKESSCNQQPRRQTSSEGAMICSAAQITALVHCQNFIPAENKQSANDACVYLEQNPKVAVQCAAEYLKYKSCSSSLRRSPNEQFIRDIYAGYHGGCGALENSQSCAGMTNSLGNPFKKWDCKIDCGGFCIVPPTTSSFLDYYRQCKGS